MDIYKAKGGKITLIDEELGLEFMETYEHAKVPPNPKYKQSLRNGHAVNVERNEEELITEAFIEKDGKKHGQYLSYYPDGNVKAECYYKEGILHGPSTVFGKDGDVLANTWFINGKRQGKSHWYHANGALYSLQRYLNDSWHGKQEYYYPNGTMKTLMNYSHGKLQGRCVLYNEKGAIEREYEYRDASRVFTEHNFATENTENREKGKKRKAVSK